MVTDPARGDAEDARLVQRVGAAARAGVHLIQIRDRGLDGGPLVSLVLRCVDAVRATRARVVVNERLDVAIAAGAHGVHLRGDSMPAARARAGVPQGFLIGRSVHSVEETERAEQGGSLDYLIFGTVFPSASKPGATAAGPERLAAAVRRTTRPVLAIGGVTAETIGRVALAGAAGFAAIGLFARDPTDRLQVTVAEAALAFDIPERVP
jgi:thiamine-phosphate pyrophosphorylase